MKVLSESQSREKSQNKVWHVFVNQSARVLATSGRVFATLALRQLKVAIIVDGHRWFAYVRCI